MTITKKVNLKSKANCEADLTSLLKDMVIQSKAENDCILYDLYQSKPSPQEFFLLEIWESIEHLEAHKQTPHFKNFGLKAPELIESKSSEELNNFQ